MKNKILLSLSSILILSACTKDRPDQFPYRQGQDLREVSDYDGLECQLNTKGKVSDVAAHSADKVEIEVKDKKSYRQFDLVEYTTNCPVFNEIPFRGAENSTYLIKYALDEKYLKVFRVAKKDMIPEDEVAISEKKGDLYRTALIAYPLDGYFIVENNKNEFGDKSNMLIETKVASKQKGSHFKINLNVFDVLNPVRQNIFAKELFDGQWFYASTVVAAGNDKKEMIGRDLSIDTSLSEVSRIEFKKYSDRVRAVNLNVDPNIDVKDDLSFLTAIEIPVKWVTYGYESNGSAKSLKQTEKSDKPWDQRDFAQVDFSGTSSSVVKAGGKSILEKLTIADNYFSFTVNYISEGLKVRYSFRRAHKAVAGKIYHSDDQKRFGFFRTVRNFIPGYRYNTREDLQKMMFLNRFYPKNNEVKFYFSNDMHPHWYRAGIKSVAAWSEAFKKAGSPIKFTVAATEVDGKIVPEKLVDVGDIRYNILNLVDIQNESNLLGYGPSIVDSESGEIISATANIYVNSYRGITVSTLRKFIMSEIGLLDKKYIFAAGESSASSVTNILGLYEAQKTIAALPSNELSKRSVENLDIELEKIAKNLKMSKTQLFDTIETNKLNKLSVLNKAGKHIHIGDVLNGSCDSFSFSNKNIIQEIKNNCPAVTDYIERLKEARSSNLAVAKLEDEVSLLETCANTLLEDKIQETLVHELGHNIGLRHNFYGNVDKDNFYSKDEYSIDGEQVQVSSTMEYMPGSQLELRIPGKYDIAAVKFGYEGKVESNDGKDIVLDTKKSIVQNVNPSSLKKYMYCTDEHVELSDPMCQRHDFGTTASEIVQNMIEEFDARNATSRFRNNQLNASQGLSSYNLARTYQPMGIFYSKWRTLLADHLVKLGVRDSGHLEILGDKEIYKMVLDSVAQDKKLADYKNASDLIFNFLTKVAFTPDHYCYAKSEVERIDVDGKKVKVKVDKLLNFSQIQKEIYKDSETTVNSCQDEVAVKYLASKGLELIEEGGVDLQDRLESLDERDLADLFTGANILYFPYEAIGFEMDRLYSYLFIANRSSSNIAKVIFNSALSPNVLDEPHYREKLLSMLQDRMLNGESKEILKNATETTQEHFMRFAGSEKHILNLQYSITLNGLRVPENMIASGERMAALSVRRTDNPELIRGAEVVVNYRGDYAAANKSNTVSYALLSEYNKINALKDLKASVGTVIRFSEDEKSEVILAMNFKPTSEILKMTGAQYFAYVKKSYQEGLQKLAASKKSIQAQNIQYSMNNLIQKTIGFVSGSDFKAEAVMEGQLAETDIISSEAFAAVINEHNESAEALNQMLSDFKENESQYLVKQDMILKTYFPN